MNKMDSKLRRVLIVDDEPDIVALLMVRLRSEGYSTLVAHNGREAIAIAREERPDLIIMDVMMPIKNGYDACKALKKSPKTRDIPIILLTVLATQENRQIGKHLGADAYITKPFSITSLLSAIHNTL